MTDCAIGSVRRKPQLHERRQATYGRMKTGWQGSSRCLWLQKAHKSFTLANGFAMRALCLFCVGVSVLIGSTGMAAERPTLIKTCDPRPDILPRPFYDNHTEYRAQYNRPRYTMGWLAYHTSRTSLEAMVWQENYCAGNYDQHHMPPVYKRYNYPKPWEALECRCAT